MKDRSVSGDGYGWNVYKKERFGKERWEISAINKVDWKIIQLRKKRQIHENY